jgi:2-polyprenyl-6-methoxyphenol hydroxylase-like FAD-dependent oxidoreductase
MPTRTTDVLVIGAGPTGLMAAVVLRRLGVDVIIADRKTGPTRESRALAVQARTLEIYEQLGIVDEVLADCTIGDSAAPGYRDKTFATIPLGGLAAGVTKYPYMVIYEQSKNEALLIRTLEKLGGQILWGHEMRSLDGTTATFEQTTVTARYVIGADGASSPVRHSRGIPFEGTTAPRNYFVADAADTTGLGKTSINVRLSADDMLLAFPMGGGRDARLIGVVGDDTSEAALREHIKSTYGVEWGDTRWLSTYGVQHRVAASFRDGPVFLAGDAAHVHSPVGGQGMNTGLQDAHNLATKLADVLQGRLPEEYLDRYEAERRPVALLLVATTERLFAATTAQTRGARFLRRRMLPVLAPLAAKVVPHLRAARRIFGYLSQTRIHYRMGPKDGKVVGRRMAGENEFTWHAAERDGHRYLVRPDGFVAAELRPGEEPTPRP